MKRKILMLIPGWSGLQNGRSLEYKSIKTIKWGKGKTQKTV